MLGHQHLAMSACFTQLLLQLVQRLAQTVSLVLLILGLRRESFHELAVAERPLQRCASQIVLALGHRQSAACISCSARFFSSRCWSAIAIATCVFTCSNWFSMSSTICFNIRS